MPIPFRDADDLDELGAAAFLRLRPAASGTAYVGALFIVNARGEPLEFAYNRVDLPQTFLWRAADLHDHAQRKLCASLFGICARVPRLLFCLAAEVGSDLFSRELRVSVPVGRISEPIRATAYAAEETVEVLEQPEPLHLFWYPGPPTADSIERRLFDRLVARGLLFEPIERTEIGLGEVYPGELMGAGPG
ncbi:MAG: hypothetical protein HY329_13425 [Chloroflexi bacterium]|nr:hypothetical protein [Chloroflexota bacterium]